MDKLSLKLILSCFVVWKDLPVAICACSAEHSDLEVGLESGKIMGCGSWSAMVFSISSLNNPPQADKPIRMLGFTVLTVSRRLIPSMVLSRAAKLDKS